MTPRLSRQLRTEVGAPFPVRVVHLGLGAFHRAHQAWYTHGANADGDAWGIAAFTGRSPAAAAALQAQDGLFTLLVRGPEGDRIELISSISKAYDGADAGAWCAAVAAAEVGVVTVTVTENGYRRGPGGGLAYDDPEVAADVALLRSGGPGSARTAPGRLVLGLAHRRAAGGAPIAVVPCDNLVANGQAARRVILELAQLVSIPLADWIESNVSFVSTTVDRITPATTDQDIVTVEMLTGWRDLAPVVTEPFSEWILAGTFPQGRPEWERAGARVVTDVAAFERRKLWLLNGAHSLLAYTGLALGYRTVAEAVADDRIATAIERWWDEAAPHLTIGDDEVVAYRHALTQRFANPRIRHRLSQIAADGSQKLPVRVLAVLRLEREKGVLPGGAVQMLGAWLAYLRNSETAVEDPLAAELTAAAAGPPVEAAARVMELIAPDLAQDGELARAIAAVCGDLGG